MSEITLPNGRILLATMMLTPDMLRSLPKVPVPVPALRKLLGVLISALPFDEEFYATAYPDLAKARDSGAIADLRTHFIEHGYFEGRVGADPRIDEEFYRKMYPDVALAIANGDVESGLDHYVRAGAAEGRFANPDDMHTSKQWQQLLGW
jgi:hypothetical protein